MLAFPFPYIANTAGWITAEVGRQPWLVYGLLRTEDGYSPNVSAANGCSRCSASWGFTRCSRIFLLFLFQREIEHGPGDGPCRRAPDVSEARHSMETVWFVLVAADARRIRGARRIRPRAPARCT